MRSRRLLTSLFAAVLGAGIYFADRGVGAANENEFGRYRPAVLFVNLIRSGHLFPDKEQADLDNIFQQLSLSTFYWGRAPDADGPVAANARNMCLSALDRLTNLLDRAPALERVWVRGGSVEIPAIRRWVSGEGVFVLRIGRPDLRSEGPPQFLREEHDLEETGGVTLEIGSAPTTYAAISFWNPSPGKRQVPVRILASGVPLATLNLVIDPPPTGTLKVTLTDQGKPTAAAAGVYAADHELMIPDTALSFDEAGSSYSSGQTRPYPQAHYWPGTPRERQVFFVDGGFSLRLPPGEYRVIAAKGPEYLPVTESVTVKTGGTISRTIDLKRWVDMPGRGWYSGDGHVHYDRADEEAGRRLMLWTQAEDVHVANVMRMGDANETFFEQSGYGKAARVVSGNFAIAPGQEDPRTHLLGHTLHMNLQKPVRMQDRYYLYDLVYDEVHRQGGLSGYAHVQERSSGGFVVWRDMALNIPKQKIDFAEISEFGDVGERLFFEFLNLGFPMTASAGSDVPWGNTIGMSRVYAYTGKSFSPDAWFAAVKAGHTFVTTGPMLELTVNGEIPGSQIQARRGDVLKVKARAFGKTVPPVFLEIVSQGEVIRSARDGKDELALDFTLPVKGSMWIAARSAGALTTPVYVKVDGQRFWRLDQVEALIAARLEHLREVDESSRQPVPPARLRWENQKVWEQNSAELRERVAAARAIYQDLLKEAKAQAGR